MFWAAMIRGSLSVVQPVQGEYARFFGQSSSPGEPVLAMSRGCSELPPVEDPSRMDIDPRHPPGGFTPGSAVDVSSIAPGTAVRPSAEGTLGQQRADRENTELPPQEQLPSAAMHFKGCLGDVLCVHVDVISILPQAVPLQQVTLVIAIMQVSTLCSLKLQEAQSQPLGLSGTASDST